MSKKVSDIKVLRITAFTIATLVTIFLLVSVILSCVAKENGWNIFYNAALLCLAGLSIFYGAYGYKLPNTRILKYSILAFAVLTGIEMLFFIGDSKLPKDAAFMAEAAIAFVAMGLIIYMSGRMDRLDENRVIIPIVFVLLIINYILFLCCSPAFKDATKVGQAGAILSGLGAILVWVAFSLMYYIRYRAYKIEPKEE